MNFSKRAPTFFAYEIDVGLKALITEKGEEWKSSVVRRG